MAATRLPSRTMQMRSDSRATRVPGGNSSGLPIWKVAGCPYVTRGLKKMTSETAARSAEPASPTLESHARIRCRGIEDSSVECLGTAGILLLLGGIHQFLQIAPEDLVLGILQIPEIVSLDGEHEDREGRQTHDQARRHRHPGQFHLGC